METGTLKELNVKPGDVVGNKHGAVFETALDEDGCICDKTDMCRLRDDYEFTLVFRAVQTTPKPDLTAITTPFGLLDEATQEALRAHGGWCQMWTHNGWRDTYTSFSPSGTYRLKPNTEVEYIERDGWLTDAGYVSDTAFGTGGQPVCVTFNRINGVIDLSSYLMKAR